MNQQINLYLPEFRKDADSLTAVSALKLLGVLVVLLLGVSVMQYWNVAQLSSDLNLKQQEGSAAIARTNSLIEDFGRQAQDQRLSEEVTKAQEGLLEKRTFLRFLEGRDLGNNEGFSEFLADLSRYHIRGLRITGVNLQNGGEHVKLSGEVLKAEFVPVFLQNLSQGKAYAGKNFEALRIEELEEDSATGVEGMSFDVSTADLGRD